MITLYDMHTHISPYQDIIFGKGQTAEDLVSNYDPDIYILGGALTSLMPYCPNISKKHRDRKADYFDYQDYDKWIKKQCEAFNLSWLKNIDPRSPAWQSQVQDDNIIGIKLHTRACNVNLSQFESLMNQAENKIILIHSDDRESFEPEQFINIFNRSGSSTNCLIFAHCARFRNLNKIAESKNVFIDISAIQSPSVLFHGLQCGGSIAKCLFSIKKPLYENTELMRHHICADSSKSSAIPDNNSCGWPFLVKEFSSKYKDVIVNCLQQLVKIIGEEKIVFGTDSPLFSPDDYISILNQSNLSESVINTILWRNARNILHTESDIDRHKSEDRADIFIQFVPPYHNDNPSCTGSDMIQHRLATEVNAYIRGAIILSPLADQPISRADAPRASLHGLYLIDAPWEILEDATEEYKNRGVVLRRLPRELEPTNPYYRKSNPLYYYDRYRFSTAEAVAYASAILGYVNQAKSIAKKLGFEKEYNINVGYK